MITIQVRGVKNQRLLSAALDLIERHRHTGYEIRKPRASLTYTLTVRGSDELGFLSDFQELAVAAGWTL